MQNIIKQIPGDYRDSVVAMLDGGWRIKRTKKGFVFLAPDGVGTVMLHQLAHRDLLPNAFVPRIRRLWLSMLLS